MTTLSATHDVRFRFVLPSLTTLLLVGAAASAHSQSHPVLDATGFHQNRDYFSEMPFENIDTLSGGLVLTFTDLVLPGNAGRELRFRRTYNSKGGGWSFGIAGIPLRILDPPVLPPTAQDPGFQDATPILVFAEGSDGRMAWADSPVAVLPETMRWTISSQFWHYDRWDRKLYIPDGTTCTYAAFAGQTHLFVSECADSFGNTVRANWDLSATPATLVIEQFLNGPPGQATDVRSVAMGLDSSFFPTAMTFLGRTWVYNGVTGTTSPVGLSWTYGYDAQGLLNSVTTPHGGVVSYTYQTKAYDVVEPGAQGFTTVVASRTTSGALPFGAWQYDYTIGLNGASVNTVVDTPSTRVIYQYNDSASGSHDSVFGGAAGVATLTSRLIQDRVGSGFADLELTAFTYEHVDVVDYGPPFGTLEVATRVVTRYAGGLQRQYSTSYAYGTDQFGNYHRPKTIVESSVHGTRTITRAFQHLDTLVSGPFILGLPSSEVVSDGNASFSKTWTYDVAGFRTSDTRHGINTTFTRDAFGNVASATKANGKRTDFTYRWGLLEDTLTPEYAIAREINPEGTVASQTQAGRTTHFSYDALFRVTSVTPPGGSAAVITEYDNTAGAWMRVSRGTSPADRSIVTTTLDGLGRPIATENSVGVRSSIVYDALGRTVYDGYPFTPGFGDGDIGTDIEYDGLDRVIRRTHPDGSYSDREHGLDTVTLTDEEGRATVQSFESFGDPTQAQLVRLVDAEQQAWDYEFDAIGQMTRVTAPGGVQRIWEFVPGTTQLSRETHPESGSSTFQYDQAGVLKQRTDANGTVFVFEHDGNDRVRSILAGGQATVIDFEDGSDNRRSTSTGSVVSSFEYDAAGRMSRRTDNIDGREFSSAFEYDANDSLRAVEYAALDPSVSRRRIEFAVDSEQRIGRIFEGGHDYAHSFDYHPSGALLAYTAGNGVTTSLTFDPRRYWPTSISAGDWQALYQNYDAVGNVHGIADSRPGFSQTFSYDALDRLTSAVGVYGVAEYQYDAHGNRETAGGTTYGYEPGTLRLAQQGSTSYAYDNNGNTIGAGNLTLWYTPHNMLETAHDGALEVDYTYDGDNWRVKKVEANIPTYYLRGPSGQLLTEWRNPGPSGEVRDYVYAGPRLIAAIDRPSGDGGGSGDPVFTIAANGEPRTVAIATAGQVARLYFYGTAGQRIYLRVSDDTMGNPYISILNPDGSTLDGGWTWSWDERLTLTQTGTHSILVDPQGANVGTIVLRLYDVPADPVAAIPLDGTAVTTTTTTPGQRSRLTFEATAGQNIYLQVVTDTMGTPYLTILNPDGTTLEGGWAWSWDDRVGLSQTGLHTIEVNPQGASIGALTLRLYDVPPDIVDAIAADGLPVTIATTVPGQNASLVFEGSAGQRVLLQRNGGTLAGSPRVSILNPDGSTVDWEYLGTNGVIDTVTLAVDGTYSIFINPPNANTGSITLRLYDVAPDISDAITADGAPVTVSPAVGQNASLTFEGVAGQRIFVRWSAGTLGTPRLSVLNPDGTTLTWTYAGASGQIDTTTLLATGTHTLHLNPSNAATGSLTLQLYDVPPDLSGSLTIGQPPTGVSIGTPGQNAIFSVGGTAGQKVTVRVTGNGMGSVTVRLNRPDGTMLTSRTSSAASFTLTTQTLATTGTYGVVVNPGGSNTGTLSVQVTSP